MLKQKIKRALISVSDKSGIIELAKYLVSQQVEIISTGGTFKLLQEQQIPVRDIANFTGFPEIMDGRVKTLHPKVHGGLLAVLDNPEHQKQASANNIDNIDLVVINLYPFVDTVKKGGNYDEVVENIDIGGPSMIRSASKNHAYKTVVTSITDYPDLIAEMEKNQGATSLEFRKNLARQAFTITANYDAAIANWFAAQQKVDFAQQLTIAATLKQKLRYGENPHQQAAVYINDFSSQGIINANLLQGKELSYNNLNDADAAFNIALEFNQPAAVIVKHANPCGVAIGDDINLAYYKAWEVDSKSAFGGIVAVNRKIDAALAQEIVKIFYEVIIAPEFSVEALAILAGKKNLRLLKTDFKKENSKYWQIKSISGGFLTQEVDNVTIDPDNLTVAGQIKPSQEQIAELIFAFKVCRHVKSNAIVVSSNLQTLGIGAGQMNRVDSVNIACQKASSFLDDLKQEASSSIKNHNKGIVLASDAFFPFADNITIAAEYGITAIMVPSGSIRDKEVIEVANGKGIALIFAPSRHFRH